MTSPSREHGRTDHAAIGVRLHRMADIAASQTRVIGRRAEKERARRRASVVLGAATGLAGLAGSVLLVVESGMVSSLWWLTIPTWILAATPVATLLQDRNDALLALHARATGTAALARELCRAFDATPSRLAGGAPLEDGLESLTRLVEQDLEAASLTLRARAGTARPSRRHRRIVPQERKVIVTTMDGRRLRATIADVSLSGVAMTECLPRLSAGDSVLIGRTWATVIRCWDKGCAFEFDAELDPSTFDVEVVL